MKSPDNPSAWGELLWTEGRPGDVPFPAWLIDDMNIWLRGRESSYWQELVG